MRTLVADRAAPGFNLYNNHYLNRANLITLRGQVVHRWRSTAGQAQIRREYRWTIPPYLGWHHIELDRDGTLYAIVGYPPLPYGGVLVALDWSSRPLWSLPIGAHHDIAIDPAGGLYTLTFDLAAATRGGKTFVLEREKVVRVVDGKVVQSISLNQVAAQSAALRPLFERQVTRLFDKCAGLIAARPAARRLVYRKVLYHYLDLFATGKPLTHDGRKAYPFRADIAARLPRLLRLFREATVSRGADRRFGRAFDRLAARLMRDPPPRLKAAVDRYLDRLFAHVDAERGLIHRTPAALLTLSDLCKANALHSNTIEVLARDVPGLGRKGDLLTSFRSLDVIAVLRPRGDGADVVWHFGPKELSKQHQPTVTPDGKILVFDNGVASKRSRVLKIDPTTRTILWSYGDREGDRRFYSWWKGGCEQLPNGNALVANTVTGEVFEVTPGRQIVWHFVAPADSPNGVAQVYRMTRLPEPMIRRLDADIGPSL